MSLQAGLGNTEARTGKTPDDFRRMATDQGFAGPGGIAAGVKATRITDRLKADFALGHGHALAIAALLGGKSD